MTKNTSTVAAVLVATAVAIGVYVYWGGPGVSQNSLMSGEGTDQAKDASEKSEAQGLPPASADESLEKKKEELFAYSRAGNFPDTRVRLRNSFHNKTLSANEYYGELAHMLSISVDNPASIVKEILESGNQYGRDVMLGNLASNLGLPQSIPTPEKNAIYEMVNGIKPELGGGINELGYSDIFRYEDWLKSLKAYAPSEAQFYRNLEDLIQKRMADPREMFALLSTFQDEGFLTKIDKASRDRYQYYLDKYHEDYPGNSVTNNIMRSKVDYVKDSMD